MKAKARIGLIVIFILVFSIMVNFTPIVSGAPTSQTITINDTDHDGFTTETGIGHDGPLVSILDPNMDITAHIVFHDVAVSYWEPLTNATLTLTSAGTLPFDADSSVTVYGMKVRDLQGLSRNFIHGPSTILAYPLTFASVNVNTSQFYGGATLEIDVTSIVDELRHNPHWDGDSMGGVNPGDWMGFKILGAPDDIRNFYDYAGDPNRAASLEIHWNQTPPPPLAWPDAVWVNQSRGLDIFVNNGSTAGWIDYLAYALVDVSGGEDFEIVSDSEIRGTDIEQGAGWDFRLWRANPSQTRTVLMGVNITEVIDTNAGGEHTTAHFFGHANTVKNVFDIDNDLNKGIFVGIHSPLNDTDGIFDWTINLHNLGAWNIWSSAQFYVKWNLIYYLNMTYDYPNQDFILEIHNSTVFDASSLMETISIIGHANIQLFYNNEFAFNTESRGVDTTRSSWNTISIPNIFYIVADENGTVIEDGFDSEDDAYIFIDGYLGPDPEDPNPPSQDWPDEGPLTRFQTRMFIWFMGYAFVFGPLGFFGSRVGKVSGYEFVIGCFLMVIGLGFLIAAGTV